MYLKQNYVCGHDVYMQEWRRKTRMPKRGANEQDPYTVAIVKRTAGRKTKVVGHMPRRISATCSLFLQQSGNIECIITGARHCSSDLPQSILEVHCTYTAANEFFTEKYLNNAVSLATCQLLHKKLSASKNITLLLILTGFNLMEASLSIHHLCQIFPLHMWYIIAFLCMYLSICSNLNAHTLVYSCTVHIFAYYAYVYYSCLFE